MLIAHLINGEEVKIADIDLKILDHLFECGCKYVRDDEVGVVLNNVAYFSEVKKRTRLIDADKLNVELSNKLNEAKYQHEGEDYFTGISEAISMLGEAPTVEERKHGHWIWDNDEEVWKCSNCKSGDDFLKNKFCKDCGAIMDEVEE